MGTTAQIKLNAFRVSLVVLGIEVGLPLPSAEHMLSVQKLPISVTTPRVNAKESAPNWPKPTTAPQGAPNILLIMLDDVGFGDTGTFGGVAQTPTLDKLAAEGLIYNRFHTAGLCSPTRAALLSGRNHHRMGFGTVGEAGFPGYNGIWKKSTASVAEILRRNGYSTAAFGKWHNTPFREISPAGPFDHWPTSLGFEYYYGNMLGSSSQWEPELWRNTLQVDPPKTIAEGYHYTVDIVNEAIQWLHTQRSLAPNKPYFIYLATGAAHAPHHVPKEWIEKYKGRFDQGWDKLRDEIFLKQKQLGVIPADAELAPRPTGLPTWNSLSVDQRRIAARQMEVYAAFIAHTDYHIGRLINAVKAAPGGENTLILYIIGDNGASAESLEGTGLTPSGPIEHIEDLGGPKYYNTYAAGWAIAGSAPFQGSKGLASYFGGTRNPLIVSWPARIKDKGKLRTQFTHVNDVAPTLYEVAGIQIPGVVDGEKQLPLDGVSFAYSFANGKAPSRHHVQYFETWGNRAIYEDGWVAAARHIDPWVLNEGVHQNLDPADSTDHDVWELYNVDRDFSEARNLAARYPEKLKRLRSVFDEEARRNHVYPMQIYGGIAPDQEGTTRMFYPGVRIPAVIGPSITGSFSVNAWSVIPEHGAEGVLISDGSRYGGFTLYVKDDHLVYETNAYGEHHRLESQGRLPRGNVSLTFEFASNQADTAKGMKGEKEGVRVGTGHFYFNGQLAGEGSAVSVDVELGNFSIGRAFGSSVSDEFRSPFEFTGTLNRVLLELR